MRGHEHIIAMRKARTKPRIVFINDGWSDGMAKHWHESNDHATVELQPGENIENLDLRFLVGVTVSISSCDMNRAKRLFQSCIDAGASTVGACAFRRINEYRVEDTWSEVFHG